MSRSTVVLQRDIQADIGLFYSEMVFILLQDTAPSVRRGESILGRRGRRQVCPLKTTCYLKNRKNQVNDNG